MQTQLTLILYLVMNYYNLSKSRNTIHKYYELKNEFFCYLAKLFIFIRYYLRKQTFVRWLFFFKEFTLVNFTFNSIILSPFQSFVAILNLSSLFLKT